MHYFKNTPQNLLLIFLFFILLIFLTTWSILSSSNLIALSFNHIFIFFIIVVIFSALYFYLIKRYFNQIQLISKKLNSNNTTKLIPENFKLLEFRKLAHAINFNIEKLNNHIDSLTKDNNNNIAILSSMAQAVVTIDLKGEIILLNSEAEKLFNLNKIKSIGQPILNSIRNSELISFFEKLINETDYYRKEIYLYEKKIFIDAIGSRLNDANNNIIGAIAIFNDITKIKKLENLREEFVANVSHELKTPITTITGYVETLQNFSTDQKQLKFLDIISKNSLRLNSIIDDLLLLSKIENNQESKKINMELTKINEIIHNAVFECDSLIKESNIEIEFKLNENLLLNMNPQLMQEALSNLINNAIKYSQKNSKITIESFQKNDIININITDYGIGIAEKHFDRLFERFYRVSESRSRDVGGTGLGLAIVKHIIEMHNGKISIKSKLDFGTTFTIKL